MNKRTSTVLALTALAFSSSLYAAVTISSPAVNTIVGDSITLSGSCATGTKVKANVRDLNEQFSPTVSVACTKAKYSATVNAANLLPGKLKLKAYQGSVAVYKFVIKPEAEQDPQPLPPRAQVTVKIMPLGDSITHGYTVLGGYRTHLYELLFGPLFYDHFNFIGSQNDGPANLPDKDHEGHPGWRTDQINDSINGWIATNVPDMVLLKIGTNDMIQSFQISTAPDRTMSIVDKLRARNPNVIILVATIFPINNTGLVSAVNNYNSRLSALVKARESAGQKVHLVDMFTGFSAQLDTSDGIHPTQAGYNEMANRWFQAILTYQNP